MLSKEMKERLADYFEGFELVEYLRLPVDDIVERFEEEILESLDSIEELIGWREHEEGSILDRQLEEQTYS